MMVNENQPSKMNFFLFQGIFFVNLEFEMGVKMNFRIITKNHAADSKIGAFIKSILESMGLMSPTRQPGS